MKNKKIIFAILTLLWVAVIFSFSLQLGNVSGSLTLLQTKVSRRVVMAMAFCLVVASMDETLQLFVDGRAGQAVTVIPLD